MKRLDRALLYARTVRHLRPAQIAHRVRLRSQRAIVGLGPSSAIANRWPWKRTAPGWPAGFAPLDARLPEAFPSATDNAAGRFRFLNQDRDIGTDWQQQQASQLWRYHLHYFDWAWSFAADTDRSWATDAFARLWRSWCAGAPLGRGDAWSPYVVSLRAWNLCGVYSPLVSGSRLEEDFVAHLRLTAAFVRLHLEHDVGGNHLVKNLKALAGLGVFFDDDRLLEVMRRHLERQLAVQVLEDGGHYERSPSYHCQVLGDLIDIADLLHAAGLPAVSGLDDAIAAMRRWLGAMLMPDGDVPLFNDCVLVGGERLAMLEPVAPPSERLTVLQPSGYVVMRPGPRLHLVADVGPPCPPTLPAHAHADCLSFELAVDGERVIVDTGTSTYEPGPRRAYERSTAAHNTVEIDGADQTEVWGTFRAARRANAFLEKAVDVDGALEVVASHDGYSRLPGGPRHRRTWRARPGPEGENVQVIDEVTGHGTYRLVWRLHLGPGCEAVLENERTVSAGPITISVSGPGELGLAVGHAEVSSRFGRLDPVNVVVASVDARLPAVIQTVVAPQASIDKAAATRLGSAGSMGVKS